MQLLNTCQLILLKVQLKVHLYVILMKYDVIIVVNLKDYLLNQLRVFLLLFNEIICLQLFYATL